MAEYLVTWTIEVDADSAEEAAQLARKIHLDPDSLATLFHVRGSNGEAWIDVGDQEGEQT